MEAINAQQYPIVARRTARRVNITEFMTEHFFDDSFRAQCCHGATFNQLAVAQHGEGVADGFQFMDTVRDKHHRDPLLLQTAHHGKKALAFMAIQRRGRLIKDQKTAVMGECPRQQDLLFLRQRTALNGPPHVHHYIKLRQCGACLTADLAPAVAMTRLGQRIKHNIFCNTQAGDQRHVHFLLHQMNAEPFRVQRRANSHH